jgi:MarR family 2-MHQ and catechol resistance regulon transcriptional repressor
MPTRHRGTPEEVRALDAYIKLERASDWIDARLDRHLTGHGLTHGQLGILETLYHCGPLCQRDLGGKVLRSSSNVTVVVDHLEQRGLVRRERDPSDRRLVTVSLTSEGRDLLRRVFPAHVGEIVELFSALTPREIDRLGALCRKLGRSIQAGSNPPAVAGGGARSSPVPAGN